MSLSRMSSLFKSTMNERTYSTTKIQLLTGIGGTVSSFLLSALSEFLEEKINNQHQHPHSTEKDCARRSSFAPR